MLSDGYAITVLVIVAIGAIVFFIANQWKD
jgi:hypothetical protein